MHETIVKKKLGNKGNGYYKQCQDTGSTTGLQSSTVLIFFSLGGHAMPQETA